MVISNMRSRMSGVLILSAILVLVLGAFVAFGTENVQAYGNTFKFNQDEYTFPNDNDIHSVSLTPASNNANIATWNSSKPHVTGLVSKREKAARLDIRGCGDTEISVRDQNGNTATCVVHIVPVKVFAFAKTEVSQWLDDGSYVLELNSTCGYGIDDYEVSWRSSDDSIVSIDRCSNESADLTFNRGGVATITAEDNYGNKATCKITVEDDSLRLERNSITIKYKYDPYYEFDPNESYCYYQNYAIGSTGFANSVQTVSGKITNVYSKDPAIASVKEVSWYDDIWMIIPRSAGTAQIVCEGSKGERQILKVTVSGEYMKSYIKYYSSCYAPYGGALRIKAPNGSNVAVSYSGKTYKNTIKSKGTCYFNVPVRKLGTKAVCTINYGNCTYKFTGKVKTSPSSIKTGTIYKAIKKTKLRLTHVHKGDTVYVKVGKKTIKKKIKKNASKYSYTVKLPNNKTEGSKVKIILKNKYKQTLKTASKKIWYAAKVRKGMTKKQCKLVPGLGSPDRWYWQGRFELWCYDRSDHGYAQLMFKNGRLWSWYY